MNDIVKVFRGRLGTRGTDGVNGAGVADIRKSVIDNPVLDCLYNNNLSRVGILTFTRTGEAVILDRYGNYSFVTGDDFTNEFPYSNDFSFWDDPFARWTISATGQTDPDAGSNATHITLDATITTGQSVLEEVPASLAAAFYTISFWIKVVSGTITGVEVSVGSDTFTVDWIPDSSWQKVNFTFSASGSAIMSISPLGTSGAVFGLYHAQLEIHSNVNPYLATSGARVTASNSADGSRHNQNGYLLESSKTNLITFSEDLADASSDWIVSGAALGVYASANPFGNTNQNSLITFSSSATGSITNETTFSDNTAYTVSVFVKLISGNITQMTASIYRGVAVDFPLITGEWVRYDIPVTSGVFDAAEFNGIVFTLISPEKNAVVAITGFQAETGGISSYIRTALAQLTRPFDLLTTPYNLGRPDEAWTFMFTTLGTPDAFTMYVFNNGLTGGDEFSIKYSGGFLFIGIGGLFVSFVDAKNAEVTLAYDGGTIVKLYMDGVFTSQVAFSSVPSVSAIGTTLNIGGDGTSVNSLDAQLGRLRGYDIDLTALEIAYISGEF